MRHALLVMVVIIAPAGTAAPVRAEQDWQTYDTSAGEWRSYAGDIAGTKYSRLEQIDAGNFGDLELAWEWTWLNESWRYSGNANVWGFLAGDCVGSNYCGPIEGVK